MIQVIPKLATANPINIPDVSNADNNIHAGTKILHNIAETYFKHSATDPKNKTLLTFASDDAGATRIAHLQTQTARYGLDPNQWFGNVELIVAREVGEETVNCVGNIYKITSPTSEPRKNKRKGLPATFVVALKPQVSLAASRGAIEPASAHPSFPCEDVVSRAPIEINSLGRPRERLRYVSGGYF